MQEVANGRDEPEQEKRRDKQKRAGESVDYRAEDELDKIEERRPMVGQPADDRLHDPANGQFMRRDPLFHHVSPTLTRPKTSASSARERSLSDRYSPRLFFTASRPGCPSRVV